MYFILFVKFLIIFDYVCEGGDLNQYLIHLVTELFSKILRKCSHFLR